MNKAISKSEFMNYLRHPAWLWLSRYDKKKLPELPENILQMGREFEPYAESVFKGGVRLGFNNFMEYQSLPTKTKYAIEKNKIVFQGRMEKGDLTCIFDVLEKDGDGYNLYEIKATTKVKAEHYWDLAFQKKVLEDSGLNINKVGVVYVNNEYVFDGKEINPEELVKIEDITEEVIQKKDEVNTHIEGAKKIIAMGRNNMPSFSFFDLGPIGTRSEWFEVYKNVNIVKDDSILYITRLSKNQFDLLTNLGVESQKDISDTLIEDEVLKFNEKQKKQILSAKNENPLIDSEKVIEFLETFEYPIQFLDYETYSTSVPKFKGTKPYQQIPVQYSLHILNEDGSLEHKEYLHEGIGDPFEAMCNHLKNDVMPKGTILTWNARFEKACNELLGECYLPEAEFCKSTNERIEDLMQPFADRDYVDFNFLGSASIKKVLPVLVPELSYKELEIQEGGTAQYLWGEVFMKKNIDEDKKRKTAKSLKEYCKLDTLAMVEIYKKLKNIK